VDKSPFVIARTFAAPRSLMWKVWTEAERLAQWWGPKGFTVEVANLDLRPGGRFHYCLRSPIGAPMWGLFVYQTVQAPEKLVYVNSFSNPEGEVVPPPFAGNWPLRMISTITFSEAGGSTTVTISWQPVEGSSEEEWATFDAGRGSMTQGWSGTFEQLEAYLAKAK
jgi:uncharacterized protein YndB with AHSA1/START domain